MNLSSLKENQLDWFLFSRQTGLDLPELQRFWLSNQAQFSSENVQLNQGFEEEGLLVKMTNKYRLFLIQCEIRPNEGLRFLILRSTKA